MTADLTVDRDRPLADDDGVIEVLLRRRDTGDNADGHRVALVVGGGGMRGAYAGGMAHAFDDAGLGGTFDIVYGSSAGAFIGAALLLGDGKGSAHIFFEDMASRAFIDLRRLGRGRAVVSLDHLLDGIMAGPKPMPWDRLASLPVPLRVIATAVDDLTPHVLEPSTPDEWKLAMRATAAIPLLAGRPVELHGRRWIDGAVSEPLAVPRALRDGATHVLVLMNRPLAELRAPVPRRTPPWARLLNVAARGLGAMAQESVRLRPAMALLDDRAHPLRANALVTAIVPAEDAEIRGLTTDPIRVQRAAQIGYESAVARLH